MQSHSFARILAALLLLTASQAFAGLIIIPGQESRDDGNRDCWVWLVPPTKLQQSAEVFFSRASLAYAMNPELAEPARRALTFMDASKRGELNVTIDGKQTAPLAFKDGKLSLSVPAAVSLVGDGEFDPTAIVDTGAKLNRGLAEAWLEAMPTGATNAWDALEIRGKWTQAFTPQSPRQSAASAPAPTSTLLAATAPIPASAKKLWPRVADIDATSAKISTVADLFGAAQREVLEADPAAASRDGKDVMTLTISLEQGAYRDVFLELGARAANLEAGRAEAASGRLKPAAARALVTQLEARYNEVHVLLARKLGTSLLIISH